jgi:hypothetical protein
MGFKRGKISAALFGVPKGTDQEGDLLRLFREEETLVPVLREAAFKPLEPSITSTISIGWVQPSDPFKTDILVEAGQSGEYAFLLLRVDEVRVSKAQVKLRARERLSAEHGDSPVRRDERLAMTEQVMAEMIHNTPVTTKLVSAAISRTTNTLIVDSTSKSILEWVAAHFPGVVRRNFCGRFYCAGDEATSAWEVSNPGAAGADKIVAEMSEVYGRPFLAYLAWMCCPETADDHDVAVKGGPLDGARLAMIDRAVCSGLGKKVVVSSSDLYRSRELLEAFRSDGSLPEQLTFEIRQGSCLDDLPAAEFTLNSAVEVLKVKVPIAGDGLSEMEILEERLSSLEAVESAVFLLLGVAAPLWYSASYRGLVERLVDRMGRLLEVHEGGDR